MMNHLKLSSPSKEREGEKCMRITTIVLGILGIIGIVYKWRYRIVNTLLAISFLRRLAVTLSMNMPTIRSKILPGLFGKQQSNEM